jgi:hypothetical protein
VRILALPCNQRGVPVSKDRVLADRNRDKEHRISTYQVRGG